MHICFVSRECSPYTSGGIGTYVINIMRALRRSGYEVTLVSDLLATGREGEAEHDLNAEGINFVVPDRIEINESCFHHSYHEYADRVYRTLCRLIRENSIDVIEFPEYRAEGFTTIRSKRLLGEFSNTTLAVKCHTPNSILCEINNTVVTKDLLYAIYMEDYAVRHADVVLSPSSSLAEYYRNRLEVDVEISPYPLEILTDRFENVKKVDRIAYVGRVEWRKGVDLLIKSFSLICENNSSVELLICGEDTFSAPFGKSMVDYLKNRCIPREISERVSFTGKLHYNDVQKIIMSAKVCVFPSRWENWPNVCLEAMLLGTPVVASKHGGMSEMLEDNVSGFLVDPTDCYQMANRIEKILMNEDIAQSLSRKAMERAHHLCDYHRVLPIILKGYSAAKSRHKVIESPEKSPLVSVIIPVFNQVSWLKEAIESVLSSSYHNVEIVLIDDGSSEVSAISNIDQIEHPRVRKFRQENRGLASARNRGIQESRGDFILPLDADDRIDENYIKDAVSALLNNPDLAYVTCYVQYIGNYQHQWIPIGLSKQTILIENAASVCSAVFRADVLKSLGGYDDYMPAFEDWDLLCRIALKGFDGDVLPRLYFFYRRHGESMMYREVDQIRAHLNQYILRKNFSPPFLHSDRLLEVLVYESSKRNTEYQTNGIIEGIESYKRLKNLIESRAFRVLRYYHYIKSVFDGSSSVYSLVLEVLGDKNPKSRGCEVWFLGIREERYGAYVLKPFAKKGEWLSHNLGNGFFDISLVSFRKGSSLKRLVSGGEIGLVFYCHPYSGLLRIIVGRVEVVIDLYSPNPMIVEYVWNKREFFRKALLSL